MGRRVSLGGVGLEFVVGVLGIDRPGGRTRGAGERSDFGPGLGSVFASVFASGLGSGLGSVFVSDLGSGFESGFASVFGFLTGPLSDFEADALLFPLGMLASIWFE